MNIGMFSDTYYPQRNGVATSLKLYKTELERMGHNVYLFIPKLSKNGINEEKIYQFPAIKFAFEKDQRLAIPIKLDVLRENKLNLDIIHTHTPFSVGIKGMFTAHDFNIPCIGTHHTMYEHYRHYLPVFIRPSLKQTQKGIKYWCEKLNKVIAPTENIRKVLESYGVPNEHIVTVPTGIDTYSFRDAVKWDIHKELNIPSENKVLLFVGRLAKEKNIDFLIKVFQKVHSEIRKSTFVIIGGGNEAETLRQQAFDLGLENDVVFTGSLSRDKVIDAYKGSDIFVFASYTETQGLVVLESMAAGTPVVALGKMGVYDILSNSESGGIMLEDLNEDDFADRILMILKDEKTRESLEQRCIKFVEDYYSIASTAKQISKVYSELIEKKEKIIG
jgi:glycosyltransferase involved in cell wall biosynthesis